MGTDDTASYFAPTTRSAEGNSMLKITLYVILMVILGACEFLSAAVPSRFPQFAEYRIEGPGTFQIPQWSFDSRYLAFLDVSRIPTLRVYDTETEASWNVATNVSSVHFSWTPTNDLTYLKYRPDLSGSPFPYVSELHQVDVNGENDEIIVTNLLSAGDFAWFGDGERLVILLSEEDNRSFCGDVYVFNARTGSTDLLIQAEEIDLLCPTMLALTRDERSILVSGIYEDNGQSERLLVIYDLEMQTVLQRIIPGQIIPAGNRISPTPTIGDGTNLEWIGGRRWFLARANTPDGSCYNYALYFFDTRDLHNSFCIPAVRGVFDYPVISPDLTRISYVTVVGPGEYFVMIGELTSGVLDRLELGDGQVVTSSY